MVVVTVGERRHEAAEGLRTFSTLTDVEMARRAELRLLSFLAIEN